MKGEAPGGEFVQKVGNYWLTIWAPWIWGYAGWLWQNGYKDAAQEWVGYIMPQSRAIRLSALAREPGTALIEGCKPSEPHSADRGGDPPGGTVLEIMAGLPTVQGGDIWERKRLGYFLYRLLREGATDETRSGIRHLVERAAVGSGTADGEAVERALGSL